MQKCPNCGFEPVEGYATCPKCGFSLQLNDQNNEDKNDTIEWSELAELPIESVQKMFKENEDKLKEADEKTTVEEPIEMNPILAQYIREHKEGFVASDNDKNEMEVDEEKFDSTKKPDTDSPVEVEASEISTAESKLPTEEKDSSESEVTTESETLETAESEAVESEEKFSTTTEKEAITETPTESEEPVEVEPAKGEESEQTVEPEVTAEPEVLETPEPEMLKSEEELSTTTEEVEIAAATETPAESEEPVEDIKSEKTAEPETLTDTDGNLSVKDSDASTKTPKKSRKKRYITLAALAVLGIGGGYYYHHEKEVEAQRIATVKKENKALDSIAADIASYYTNKDQTFLVADKVNQDPSSISEELAQYKDNKRYDELKREYDSLTDKQKAEQAVNQLFANAVINGEKLAEKPLLKVAEPVNTTVNTDDQAFNNLLNQAIDLAKDQYSKVEAAKKAADSLLKDGKVIDSVSRDQYNAANNAVKAVANQALVQSQKDELTKVDQMLKDKEKKAADEKAAAEKAAAEKAAKEKAAQEAQKKADTDTSQAGDTSSDAYAWAPGVKEKVIQTCISRGYIVEGGYSLEPVKIENGEGYYNLYATSNRASLTKGYSNSDLPMYLVTINCKTGWFKGNGPN
ncbi:cell division site-positioning protein MapZ family protein [Enterococcus pseudoavium]|uniref:Cell division site-positioning protein MapZ family protein n=1 Tax=Enterococcus pseudoavium TaxID=44007 RepID=A0AAE4I060_9ENTE|nr:cell division site-positioning protein MapZ family protein [Enterococcus pseudoavium]MDT2737034.1 cell division site-positioning protein MapZ family protein [Enterococcus pseudoavium]